MGSVLRLARPPARTPLSRAERLGRGAGQGRRSSSRGAADGHRRPADRRRRRDPGGRLGLDRRLALAIARSPGATVIEIEPGEFGHGRTRNLAACEADGRPHRVPDPGRHARLGRVARTSSSRRSMPRRGSASSFGPHLPRPDTSPMIARELDRVLRVVRRRTACASIDERAPGRRRERLLLQRQLRRAARVLGGGPLPRRRLRRGPGVRARRDGGRVAQGLRAGAPACCTRTTIPWREFMRRYFDEYRGLRETTGHVEPAPGRRCARRRAGTRRTRATCAHPGHRARRRLAWTARSAAPPRRARGVRLRSARAPTGCRPRLRRRLSLEGTRGDQRRDPAGGARRPGPRSRTRRCARHYRRGRAAGARPPSPTTRARARCTSHGSCRRSGAAAAAT